MARLGLVLKLYQLKWAVIMTAHLLFILPAAFSAPSLGLWVIRDQLTTHSKIDEFITFARQNDIHHLFVQVRGRGDAFYQSRIVTFNELLPERNWDPLAYTLQKAHAQGIKVHAWVNVFLLWTAEQPPRDPTHLIYQHPEWCSVDDDGIKDLERPFTEFQQNRTEGIYLAPTVPDVRRYLLEVIRELAMNYDLDGIHLDYIRYPKVNYDYNVVGRMLFKDKYGIDPILLSIKNKEILKRLQEYNIQEYINKWDDFRRAAVTSFVQDVSQMLANLNRPIMLSAAVKPDPDEARHFFFQDWEHWLKSQYLDFVVLMNYSKSNGQFENCLKKIDKQIAPHRIWMGIGVYNQTPLETLNKIALTYSYRFPHIVFFSYETFQKDTAYYAVLRPALMGGR